MQRLSEANFVFCDELARSVLGNSRPFGPTLFHWKYEHLATRGTTGAGPRHAGLGLRLGPAPWRLTMQADPGGCGARLDYYDFGMGVAGWGQPHHLPVPVRVGDEAEPPPSNMSIPITTMPKAT